MTVVLRATPILGSIGGQDATAKTGFWAALFNANTYLTLAGGEGYFDVRANLNALLHTWSLSVGEQFYLVFPAVFFGAWVLGRKSNGSMSRVGATTAMLVIFTTSFLLS